MVPQAKIAAPQSILQLFVSASDGFRIVVGFSFKFCVVFTHHQTPSVYVNRQFTATTPNLQQEKLS